MWLQHDKMQNVNTLAQYFLDLSDYQKKHRAEARCVPKHKLVR